MQNHKIKLRKRPARRTKKKRLSLDEINFKLQMIADEDQEIFLANEINLWQ